MSELRSAIDGLAAVDVAGLPDVAGEDDLRELRSAINRLEAQFQRRLAVFDTRGVAEAQGRLSTASWLTQQLHVDPPDGTPRGKRGRRLADTPVALAAFEAGEIALDHARVIATTVAEMKPENKAWAEA